MEMVFVSDQLALQMCPQPLSPILFQPLSFKICTYVNPFQTPLCLRQVVVALLRYLIATYTINPIVPKDKSLREFQLALLTILHPSS